MKNSTLTGIERTFQPDDFLVSKTNLKGHLTYANRAFIDLAGYDEKTILGAPHSIVRHPDMPRAVFKLLWNTIEQEKKEIFAYVVNRSANGDHYWVFAHVTPSYDSNGTVIGYHSNRRIPDRTVLNETIIPLYKQLLDEEAKHANAKDGMNSSYNMLLALLQEKGVGYDELIFSLGQKKDAA